MAYLQNEKARFQDESQAAGEEITTRTAELQPQQQAIVAAQARVSAAQTRLTDAEREISALAAAAAAADGQVADLENQIEAHLANEPEPFIESEFPNKPPRPNPEWGTWNTRLGQLTQQLDQAQANAAAAHVRLNDGTTQVSQARAELQAAERQAAEAIDALNAINQALAAARERQASAQTMLTLLDQWNEELARDPLDRMTLETVAASLSDRTTVLEDAHAVARVENEIAEETLSSLSARRDQLEPALNAVKTQLTAADAELTAARAALHISITLIRTHVRGGP